MATSSHSHADLSLTLDGLSLLGQPRERIKPRPLLRDRASAQRADTQACRDVVELAADSSSQPKP